MNIREQIESASKVIEGNIDILGEHSGLMSQNILSQLRNLIEVMAVAIHGRCSSFYAYEDIQPALKYIDKIKDYKYIYKLYKQLEIVASHYTLDAVNSEHLVYHYYSNLIKLKQTAREKLGVDILNNISRMFKAYCDYEQSHYESIFQSLSKEYSSAVAESGRLYVSHQRPIVVNGNVFYEAVLSNNKARNNKVDGTLVYSLFELPQYYAVKVCYVKRNVRVNGIVIPITVVKKCNHAIYPKEFNLLSKILGCKTRVYHSSKSYKQLMSILDDTYATLVDIIENIENYNVDAEDGVWRILYCCKKVLNRSRAGSVTMRYLIHTLNYSILIKQYDSKSCVRLSNLNLRYGCIPFDEMPYCTSLIGHNPNVVSLLECIDYRNREHEFLNRFINNKANRDNQLYVDMDELSNFEDIPSLVSRFNGKLYEGHSDRKMLIACDKYIYIKENETSLSFIMKSLLDKCAFCVRNHEAFTNYWISNRQDSIDSDEKIAILKKLFAYAQISLIVGPAGTGKTTLINYISELYERESIYYVANTNAAVENIKRKVPRSVGVCETVNKFLQSKKGTNFQCAILVVDECSTIPNQQMVKLLKTVNCSCIVLVGDDFQLGAIEYGNWFDFAKKILPKNIVHELKTVHRSSNNDLRLFWNEVRGLKGNIRTYLAKINGSSNLDATVYERFSDDQIILNLNYDGLYGINNINTIMQGNNASPAIPWGVNVYKVGDPVIFLESSRFSNIFYNNLKGRITNIERKTSPTCIVFEVEIDRVLTSMTMNKGDFQILQYNDNSTVVRFEVFEPVDEDEEDDERCIVPFVVSYATSIHKSQGLEFNSVKIIITEDNKDNITHDVFYTAITRARDKLTIYWTKETEEFIINNLKLRNIYRDLNIFKRNTALNNNCVPPSI